MKKQNKKAFTLVELLVVIAILAILAAVAVVGYTSFIKNAAISNDENVVAQMNRYLEALKADSTSEFYGKDIDDSNIGALLAELKAQGLESVEPHAEKYGYHYYFNEKDQKFVLADNGEGYITGASRHFSLFASAADEGTYNSLSPYSCFTKKGYLFADLGGEWAELVEGFGSVTSEDQLAELYEGAGNMELGGQPIYGLAALMDVTAFVTEEGIFQTSDKERVNVEIQDAPTGNIKNEETGKVLYPIYGYVTNLDGTSTPLSQENPLLNPTEEYSDLVIPEGVTYVATEFINNIVKSEAKVTVEDQEVDVKVNVTFDKENGKDIADALDLEAHVVNTNVTVVNANGTKVEIKTTVTTESDGSTTITTEVKVETEVEIHPVEIKNWTTDFDLNAGDNVLVEDDKNYVAWDKGEFTLTTSNFVGKIAGQPVADYNKVILWSILGATGTDADNCDDYISVSEGKVTLKPKADGTVPAIDSITVRATAADAGKAVKEIVIDLVRVTEATSLKLAGKSLTSDMTLVCDGGVTAYNLSNTSCDYNTGSATANALCTPNISWKFVGGGMDTKSGTDKVEVAGKGSGVLTISIGNNGFTYKTYDVNLTIESSTDFALVPNNGKNITVLGNNNKVLLSDLFTVNGAIPAGAEVVVFSAGNYEGDTYMNPSRAKLRTSNSDLVVDVNTYMLNDTDLTKYGFQFTGTTDITSNASKIRIAVMHNGVRISEDVTVHVVNGYNVRDYSELTTNVISSNAFTKSAVLLGDMIMTKDVNYLTIGKDYTLYGNGYTFNIERGRNDKVSIISLAGTLRDVKIVGSVYKEFAFSRGLTYGSSAVAATGKAHIINSYIANTRSPLLISGDGSNVIVENSVLFGGRYSNIDVYGNVTLNIRGTVTTVQQLVDYDAKNKVIGLGVAAWFNDNKKNVVVESGANLVQYNFMDSSISQYLPELSFSGIDIMDLKEPFNEMFGESSRYEDDMYTALNGNMYVNSGIAATDKYMLNYTVTGDNAAKGKDEDGKTKDVFAVGKTKTVQIVTAVGDEEEFIIVYDTRLTPNVGVPVTEGQVKVTGAQLKTGVVFTANANIYFTRYLDGSNYLFQVQSDKYKTLNISGSDVISKYSSLTYSFDTFLGEKMNSFDTMAPMLKQETLTQMGLHYGYMCIDVNTPIPSATAVGSYTYQHLLEQYIEMTDGDGTNDNFYTPDNFKFVNGSITNYWNK